MSPGVRKILERIVHEMGDCSGGKCADHAVRFGVDDLAVARAELAEATCAGCAQGLALCTDYTTGEVRKYHMASNGVAVAHTEK